MSLEDLAYPVLRLNERGVRKARRPADLRLMPQPYFAAGGFQGGSFIIDSSCRKYEVLEIRALRRSYNLTYLITGKHRMYVVDYELGPPVQLSFVEARATVIDLIVRKRWYGQGGETRAKFVARLEACSSMPELMATQEGYGTVWY
jgi:hypothetical protein